MDRSRVLVVDDDRDIATVCRLHLEMAGYDVREANSGTEAVDRALDFHPDAIVLDYMLPDFDGIEVLKHLQADPATADIPVVMVTARTHVRDQTSAWEAGVVDYLTKPFDSTVLVGVVRDALDTETPGLRDRRRTDALTRLHAGDAESLRRLAAIVEGAGDAVVGKSLDGAILSWNAGAERLFGWSAEEAIGESATLLAGTADIADAIGQLVGAVSSSGVPATTEAPLRRKDGSAVVVSLTVSPVRGITGDVVGVSTIARDVTDRARAEAKFRGLVEGSPDAIVIVDEDGTIELVNEQTQSLFGYTREQLVGQSIERLIPKRYRDKHPGFRRSYATQPRTREMGAGLDLHGLHADGHEFPVEISLSPLAAEHGVTFAATIRDATVRKQAEAKFRGLLEAAPDAMVGVDVSGRIVLVNAQTEALFGYPRDELIGQLVEVLVPESLRADHPAHRAGYFTEPRTRPMGEGLDLVARRRDGSEFPAEISLSSIETEDGLLVSAAIRDVTERKRAELLFRGLVEAAPDAMVIVDQSGRISLVNAQTVALFGWDKEELVGQPVETLVPTRFRGRHPEHRRGYGHQPRTRGMGAGLDLYGLRKDGTEFPVEISLSPIETDEGVTISAAIRDVSERKRSQEAQSQAFDREREAGLRLREVDRLRTDFLSTVSHELRTPLTAIKGFAEFLTGAWESTPDNRKLELVDRILRAGIRLDNLIQDLLDFSRLERGQLSMTPERVRLADLVAETIDRAGPSIESHVIAQNVEGHHQVLADRTAMIRVIDNLIGNAAKFSPHGSTITITSRVDGDRVVMSVSDDGIGIDATEQQKIFDRFYRVPESAGQPGTGIGLAIVKQFVEAQSGTIDVVSSLGSGSEFRVSLPIAR